MAVETAFCEAVISTAAIRENARALCGSSAEPLLADVSADGFGHGAVDAAIAALDGGVQWLGVTRMSEARELRDAGITDAPILVALPPERDDADVPVAGAVVSGTGEEPQRLARVGEALYGLGAESASRGLSPAMRVSATVMGVKTIDKGEGVSYGYTFRAPGPTTLALVGIGYADGLDRRAGNVCAVSLRGTMRRIVGRVAMNAAVIDIGDDDVRLGDEAVFFGGRDGPTATSWAEPLGIPEAEAVTVFGRLLRRRYA